MPDLEERVAALEAAVAQLVQPEPDFMTRTRVETLRGTGILNVRLLHEPTGITIATRDRPEGIYKLRKALADRARREYDLQEAGRRRERKAAQAEPDPAVLQPRLRA